MTLCRAHRSRPPHDPCRAHAVRGERTCKAHSGGRGGRPIVHGRYSKKTARIGVVLRNHVACLVLRLERMGAHLPRDLERRVETLLDPPARCGARARSAGGRPCRLPPIRGRRRCRFHGGRGGRPGQNPWPLGTLVAELERRHREVSWKRLEALARGQSVSPPASSAERALAAALHAMAVEDFESASQATRRAVRAARVRATAPGTGDACTAATWGRASVAVAGGTDGQGPVGENPS